MKVDLFDFDLPEGVIAQHPASPRDSARLLVVADGLLDRGVCDLPALLEPGDVMVFNDTRVIPARLNGRLGEGKMEVTLHKRVDGRTWNAFARPAKKLKPGSVIQFADDFSATVSEKGDGGEVTLSFNKGDANLMAAIAQHGIMPLPPYIKRAADGEAGDASDYQTIFANREGAVAAPTAGLHVTDDLIAALEARGIRCVLTTLHVGAGTFLPVKVDDTKDHVMHAEWGEVTAEAAGAVNAAKQAGGRVVAGGTTALRLLESAADAAGTLHAFQGDTDIFITPGYRFKIVDVLMTNFHLPRSTLFMLVSAFAGLDTMKAAYTHAIKTGYRFYSYGDASLLSRSEKTTP